MLEQIAIAEAKRDIDELLVKLGKKHGVEYQWRVQFPPIINALMQQAGVVEIQAPSIELTCTLVPMPMPSPDGNGKPEILEAGATLD